MLEGDGGFRPRRRRGQNFLVNAGAIRSILEAFDPRPGDRVLEVGPGRGALTEPLVERVGRLVAVEVDRDLAVALAARLERHGRSGRLEIVAADVLDVGIVDLVRRLGPGGRPARLIANLPYNIATAVLLDCLRSRRLLGDLLVMVQREVAERLLSRPGRRTYGSLSVLCQCFARMEIVLRLRPGSFRPRPRVESSVVRMVPLETTPGGEVRYEDLSALLRAAFEQRRKTLQNNLSRIAPGGSPAAEAWIRAAGLDPRARPESIPVDGYVALLRLRPAL